MTFDRAQLTEPRAVLFDRDGTLVVDVTHNGDPALVEPMPTVRESIARLRSVGIPLGVVTNQSAIGLGLITSEQAYSVNDAIDRMLGPFDLWEICPHVPNDLCLCRKPQPGMILNAAERLGLEPGDIAMIGDIGSDIEAATRAGARSVLVPTPVTRAGEIAAAPLVASTLAGALVLLGFAS
jgi:D-glycero-D-manno-heptose 1,7-bisphosphate phosphatase